MSDTRDGVRRNEVQEAGDSDGTRSMWGSMGRVGEEEITMIHANLHVFVEGTRQAFHDDEKSSGLESK